MLTNRLSLLVVINGLILLASADIGGPICNFAPLCGSRNATWELLEDPDFPMETDGVIIGSATIEFSDCCSLKDTQPVQDCEIVNPTGSSERFATSFTPICDTDPDNCEAGTCDKYELVFQPVFIRNPEPDGCCDTCKCYGDPQCVSFDGIENIWVLCDGREVPEIDETHVRCRITEAVCNTQKDHAGNTCHYKHWNKNGKFWDNSKKGSPCVPNPASPPSVITMYEIPSENFKLDLTQGERGTITDLLLELDYGTFSLNALKCLTDGKNGWKIVEGALTELPEVFQYKKLVEAEDIIWDIVDPVTGIAINVRCYGEVYVPDATNPTPPPGGVYMPRINVESLSEPAARTGAGGYCVTSQFDFGESTTANTEIIESNKLCIEGLEEFNILEIYREICQNPALPHSGIEDCAFSFCSRFFAPLYANPEECVTGLQASLKIGFCNAIVYVPEDVNECIENWEDFGAIVTIQQYYEDLSGCTNEYLSTKPDCQGGITLQFLNDARVWVDVIFIPEDYCGNGDDSLGHIILNKCEYPEVFTKPVRLVQNSVDSTCGLVNQCKQISGFTGFVALNIPPTPYPTLSPTFSPSPFPTTAEPTASPTSSYPTANPTQSPTPFPTTLAPTTPYPTEFPTTANIPPTPSCEYRLCGTEEDYFNISSTGMVHTRMEPCCPPYLEDICPGTIPAPTEWVRMQGTNQSFCGSKHPGVPPFKKNCENSDKLNLQVSFMRNADTSCCLTCSCYGDPRCDSFFGGFDEFILCDGREAPESGAKDERCVITKETCEAQKDHEGRPCRWENPYISVPNLPDSNEQAIAEGNFDVVNYGSPCQYDSDASEPSVILLYKIDGYELSVEQYDRGYIRDVYINTSYGKYSLNVDDCLAGHSWTTIEKYSTKNDFFGQASYSDEYLWTVIGKSTGIEMGLRCTGVYSAGHFTKVTFINIDFIHEPDVERAAESGEGFCPTGNIPEKDLSTYSHSIELREKDLCNYWNENKTDILLRNVAREITDNPGLSTYSTETAYQEFCNSHFAPRFKSADKCRIAFMTSTNVHDVIVAFCQAVTSVSDSCIEGVEMDAEISGYQNAFKQARITYLELFSDFCTITPDQLSNALVETNVFDECVSGVLIQYLGPEGWTTYKAIPGNFAPCQGIRVEFSYKKKAYRPLFEYPIRIQQKYLPEKCTACDAINTVDTWIQFN